MQLIGLVWCVAGQDSWEAYNVHVALVYGIYYAAICEGPFHLFMTGVLDPPNKVLTIGRKESNSRQNASL
jgi:hypothetical protein